MRLQIKPTSQLWCGAAVHERKAACFAPALFENTRAGVTGLSQYSTPRDLVPVGVNLIEFDGNTRALETCKIT